MSYQSFLFEIEDKIARITLNRPDASNAMNLAFWREIREIFAVIDGDASVRAVVIDGAGKHFTSGMDLSVFGNLSDEAAEPSRRADLLRRRILEFQESFNAVERCRVPVLMAIHGACIGGGIDFVTAADMRYASEDAFFAIHETNIGMTADVGTLQRAPKLIPDGILRELAYTGRRWQAAEAQAIGFVNHVYSDKAALLEAVMAIARTIAEKSPLAVAGCKEMIAYARDHSVADGLNYIATWNAGMLSRADLMAGLTAQREKRQPDYDDLLALATPGES